jgi:D-lyxose ketol-isomerase
MPSESRLIFHLQQTDHKKTRVFWIIKSDFAVKNKAETVNDDNTDNRFYEPVGRFPAIEEDQAPLHLLCNEYPKPGRPVK